MHNDLSCSLNLFLPCFFKRKAAEDLRESGIGDHTFGLTSAEEDE